MRHWMFLTHPDNWEKCLEHQLFGFDEEYAYTVEHYVNPGDQAIIYLAKQSAVWGVVEVQRVMLEQTEPIGWLKKGWEARKGEDIEGLFPARVRFKPITRITPPRKIGGRRNPFRNQLEYITDKRRWNVFVQIALSRVPQADVRTVQKWAKQPTEPELPHSSEAPRYGTTGRSMSGSAGTRVPTSSSSGPRSRRRVEARSSIGRDRLTYVAQGFLTGRTPSGKVVTVEHGDPGPTGYRLRIDGRWHEAYPQDEMKDGLGIGVHVKRTGSQAGYPSEPVIRAAWRHFADRYNKGDENVRYSRAVPPDPGVD